MNQDVSSFIGSSFPSVWTLELLLLLQSERRVWRRDELIDSLRASEQVVSQALDSLVAGGLATLSDDGAEYRPASEAVEAAVEQTRDLYSRKPDQVRRIIVTSSSGGIAAFADAFRLRRD